MQEERRSGVDTSVYDLLGVHPNGGSHAAEVIQRLILVMLNEAARAYGEGVVRSPRDGDIGGVVRVRVPAFRGGPLRHADDLGAARVVVRIGAAGRAPRRPLCALGSLAGPGAS